MVEELSRDLLLAAGALEACFVIDLAECRASVFVDGLTAAAAFADTALHRLGRPVADPGLHRRVVDVGVGRDGSVQGLRAAPVAVQRPQRVDAAPAAAVAATARAAHAAAVTSSGRLDRGHRTAGVGSAAGRVARWLKGKAIRSDFGVFCLTGFV